MYYIKFWKIIKKPSMAVRGKAETPQISKMKNCGTRVNS